MDFKIKLMNKFKVLIDKFFYNSNSFVSFSVEKQKKYLESFCEPDSDVARSFFQYKCTMYRLGKIKSFLMQIASIFLLPFYYCTVKKIDFLQDEMDAVFMTDGISIDTIPQSLIKKYKSIKAVKFGYEIQLTISDKLFLKEIIKRYPLSFYFNFKVLLKIAMYSAAIDNYNPSAIISYTESSFTSAISTLYCEGKNIKHLNIMHGERSYDIQLSFFRFTEFYIWDNYYLDLYNSLRNANTHFVVELPKSVILDDICLKNTYKYYITYYLGNENKKTLLNIKKILLNYKNSGQKCCVRIHPRTVNRSIMLEILKEFDIQSSNEVSLVESFNNTEFVASCSSTVLYQAWINGKKIIIDDYSSKKKYKILTDVNYIMLSKPHKLISNDIKDKLKNDI